MDQTSRARADFARLMFELFWTVMTLVMFALATVGGIVWNGYVFAILWGWFITGLGAPQISTAAGIGIIAMAHLARGMPRRKDPTDVSESPVWLILAITFLPGALALTVGCLASLYL